VDEFVAIDFETADYAADSAISLGLARCRGGEVVDEFYSLARPPELFVRPDFTRIHGLTVDDLREAPDFAEVWEGGARDFIGDTALVAHNASFDMRVLRATLARYDIPPPDLGYFCSLALARRAWPGLRSHALTALGKEFDIVYDAHNALADARTCASVVFLGVDAISARRGRKKPLSLSGALREAGVYVKRLRVL